MFCETRKKIRIKIINVIQTTEGRKNLGNIKWLFPRFFAKLCFALNDISE